MSGCCRNASAWSVETKPPVTSWNVTGVKRAKSLSIAWHCTASSRVGMSTMALVATCPAITRPAASRFLALTLALWHSRSNVGSRKEAVFPEPVSAVARISRPCSADGMTSLWIGVADVNPRLERARRRGLESLKSANWTPVERWLAAFSVLRKSPADLPFFSSFSPSATAMSLSPCRSAPVRPFFFSRASIFSWRPLEPTSILGAAGVAWSASKSHLPASSSSSSLTRSEKVRLPAS
mmetsp:Transcript_21882/g.46776  ORF Transcript_21882/g.46776 Transcript_21882/m.46776 type:complete len:238 (-) Transcript_21882:117-830(-)